MSCPPCVVKVGGSLYSWPEFGPRLQQFLAGLAHPRVVLVPGGGPFADAVRAADRAHVLGEEAAHWLALRSLSLAANFLAALVPDLGGITLLDAFAFALEDEARPDHLPHSWNATSDSLAARVAHVVGADRVILLKSADPPAGWQTSAYVDAHFAQVIARATFTVEAINLRNWVQ